MDLQDLLNQENSGDGQQKASPLKSLETDLKFYSDSMKEVAVEIMVEGISAYPIFIAHQHEVNIGEVILDRNELNTEWTIQVSTLEEFVERNIIHEDKKELFIKHYKSAHKYMCLFVIVPEGANFVFYPYTG
ncbi:hypothetical protein FW774_15235 [Pedobacter sp. BS3]|uniref:hypothetical protein n=1 Tax=Pedobacter sp. BS3 TaxID=2567937 RepID=UPI0011ED8B14|nr:hypothetical protein [Pedobacter sp. BS3]TZF82312.1 hypothetical protein FW774_15235 [Pedobacter sp. BS3]